MPDELWGSNEICVLNLMCYLGVVGCLSAIHCQAQPDLPMLTIVLPVSGLVHSGVGRESFSSLYPGADHIMQTL